MRALQHHLDRRPAMHLEASPGWITSVLLKRVREKHVFVVMLTAIGWPTAIPGVRFYENPIIIICRKHPAVLED